MAPHRVRHPGARRVLPPPEVPLVRRAVRIDVGVVILALRPDDIVGVCVLAGVLVG